MKRKNGSIALLFQKHEAKKNVSCAPPPPISALDEQPSDPIVDDNSPIEKGPSVDDNSPIVVVTEGSGEDVITPPADPVVDEGPTQNEEEPPLVYNVDCLEHDPGLRVPISRYDVNDQDAARRGYILKGPCQLWAYDYPIRKIYGKDRRFSEESNNRGNFLELLKWLAGNNEEVNKLVLKNAPGNCILTSPRIQKQIIRCCSIETTRYIIEELGDDHYAILADESSDISYKEQLAVCLRYVDKLGRVCERFLGVVHVSGTTSLELKTAIQSLLTSHHLTLTQIRGQGYDGASNMKGEVKGLKTLIMKESLSAYYVHCFAHQLQLVLVAVAKGNVGCQTFFGQVSRLLNIVGVSCKRHDMLRDVRAQKLKKALDLDEIESGSGLNQEMGLARPGDTRWGSHYKTILHIIDMYDTIREVLITLGNDPTQKDDWPNIHAMVLTFESFEFIFNAHLMLVILGYTNELSNSLQKRDQDIVNAMTLVGLAKKRMQQMRSYGWEGFLGKVTSFCIKYSIDVPAMDAKYEPHGRSHRFYPEQTIDDHYRREVYIGVIDRVHQELENRFDEVNMELLLCMSAFNPSDSFASFDAQKILRLASFYPKDIASSDLMKLELQLDTYIDDMREDDRFKGLNNLGELSIKLVETKKHDLYDLVYLLLKLVLILPVATATVERVFSAMCLVKNKMRNRMGDQLLNDCLVTFIERDIFSNVSEDDIVHTFIAMKKRKAKALN